MKAPFRPAPRRHVRVARCAMIAARSTAITIAAIAAIFAFAAATPAQVLTPAELKASKALENVRANPLELEAFLTDMPKGTDLHMHLSGH